MTHLCLVLSDLHFGKQTNYGYDLREAEKRYEQIPDKLAAKYPEPPDSCWLLYVGDLFEGSGVYPHQDAENAPLIDAKQLFVKATVAMVRRIQELWPDTRIHCRNAPGNHAYMTKTGSRHSNHDTEALGYAGRLLGEDAGDWKVGQYLIEVVDIGGYRVLIQHKINKHAASNALQERIRRRLRGVGADLVVAGHWHAGALFRDEDSRRPLYLRNGSLCGRDEHTDDLGYFPEPVQAVFGVRDGQWAEDLYGWLEW